MKLRVSLAIASLTLGLILSGCSGSTTAAQTGQPPTAEQTLETVQPALDLAGSWHQVNSNSTDAYQDATIEGTTITVEWVNAADGTTALYWVGTYVPPTEALDSYSWDSVGDRAQMDAALLASGDDAKSFTYAGGRLSYELTAMGVTMTVQMERQ